MRQARIRRLEERAVSHDWVGSARRMGRSKVGLALDLDFAVKRTALRPRATIPRISRSASGSPKAQMAGVLEGDKKTN